MNLQVAASNLRKKDAARETAQVVLQNHTIIGDDVKARGVFGIHQHSVARCPVERVNLGINERVELFAATGGNGKFALPRRGSIP